MADLGLPVEELRTQNIDWLAQVGAQLIINVALEAEIEDALGRVWYEHNSGPFRGYRNGHRLRAIQCRGGEVELQVPRVAKTSSPFRSSVLPSWQRKSEVLRNVIPGLFLEGLSTRDFRRALWPLWGKSGLSRSTISRCNRQLKEQFREWRQRNLSSENILYLFLDGFYLGFRQGQREKEGVLVAHGIRNDGSRCLLSISAGGKESTAAWRTVIQDMVRRGLTPPRLVISDGNPGLIRAVEEVLPGVPRQRCVVHRMRNVLARIPKRDHDEVKKALNRIFHAKGLTEALVAAEGFARVYGKRFPTATAILGTDLADCLTYYRFPKAHGKRIRTTNVLERVFVEVRRRTKVVGRFPDELSALCLIFGVIERAQIKWRGLRLKDKDHQAIDTAVRKLEEMPIDVRGFEAYTTAA